MIVRPTHTDDTLAVAALVRASFDPRLHRYMIYAQHGVEHFLRAMLDHARLFPDRILLTCEDDSGVVAGFAEFRLSGETVLLSYICVSPAARRRGIATSTMTHFLDSHPDLAALELDVFEDNLAALDLYRKTGFIGTKRLLWLVRPLPQAAEQSITITSVPGVLAAFARYGFCELPTLSDGVEHRLGRIGRGVLRCFSAHDFEDDILLSGMRHLMPELREALTILPAEQSVSLGEQVNASLRLTLPLAGQKRP